MLPVPIGFNAPVPPRLTFLGVVGASSGFGSDTVTCLTNIALALPSGTRRIIGVTANFRTDGDGGTARPESASFGNGSTFDIAATMHANASDGDGSANSAIGIGLFSAIVPDNSYTHCRIVHGRAVNTDFNAAFWAVHRLQNSTPSDSSASATHANGSSISNSSVTYPSGGIALWVAANLSSGTSMSWSEGTEDFDEGAGTLGFSGIRVDPASSSTPTVTASFGQTVSARAIAGVSWI